MKNASIFFFLLATLFAPISFGANSQYVPARQVSINTNSFGSIIATNDVPSTQSTVQTAFEWLDDNFPTNISKTNVYATQTFVSNNFYLASNPSGYINTATASNLYYSISNPSGYVSSAYVSNYVASNSISMISVTNFGIFPAFRLQHTQSVVVAANTWYNLPFSTNDIEFNVAGNTLSSSNPCTYTVSTTNNRGIYLLNGHVQVIQALASNTTFSMYARIIINGSAQAMSSVTYPGTASTPNPDGFAVEVNTIKNLNNGDAAYLQFYHSHTTNITIGGSLDTMYFSGAYQSRIE